MTTDAMGNEFIVGNKYGYSINQNGIIQIVVGICDSIGFKKVTLREVEERTGVYGTAKDFVKQSRKRSAYGANMFPVGWIAYK